MFEWDESKSNRNLAERGFDFEFASRIFAGDVIEREDTRRNYGERRIVALGAVEEFMIAVTYTWRGRRRRIISARLANRRERRTYRRAIGEGNVDAEGKG